jgi:dipeptidyl aminopeptidase/acylaminoacyl peptidase
MIVNDKQESLGEVIANDAPTEIVIDGRKFEDAAATPRRRRRVSPNGNEQPSRRSPDGKWEASIENFNVAIRSTETNQINLLSADGREGLANQSPIWSPDSQYLISFRVQAVEVEQVHRIRSSPKNGGRAQLESSRYTLPGDPLPTHELNLFSVATNKQVKPEIDRYEHEWQRPRIRFNPDGKRFYYEQTDRGHGRFRLIEVSTESGAVKNIIDEKSPTFIWTAHTENQRLSIINWLLNTNEIIHATEKNGWRQLILIDATTGEEKRELTPRGIVVRGIDLIDEENRRVWLTASGRPHQDPYLLHCAHVDLDSGKLTWLTEADGNHSIEFSPDRKYLIDSYSRVDSAPTCELRRCEDGQLVCSLEQADISELRDNGWSPPEVFVAKGRDGQTDIWGIICRPRDFDPNKKYPVIEDIYAGPQGSFVPKSFSPRLRHDSLTSSGFIVVQIDGMGTANRSKAFHDVCWKNLKDGGLEDRISWMKAAAQKYPELDLSRVGIYGTSAGGQNAAAAVLFHPEFYNVAVAACGCHDNRMDKASWNEQWMGYPVGQHYSDCSNIDNAHRLQGKLLLIVGEMDSNVPPESTLRFADALIRADKDFDLLVVPNAGHGMGGAYGQRRMHNYFVQHLLSK